LLLWGDLDFLSTIQSEVTWTSLQPSTATSSTSDLINIDYYNSHVSKVDYELEQFIANEYTVIAKLRTQAAAAYSIENSGNSGSVLATGDNTFGNCGDGTLRSKTKYEVLPHEFSVYYLSYHQLAIKFTGTVDMIPNQYVFQVKTDKIGDLYAFGRNENCQADQSCKTLRVPIQLNNDRSLAVFYRKQFKEASAGKSHSLALDEINNN